MSASTTTGQADLLQEMSRQIVIASAAHLRTLLHRQIVSPQQVVTVAREGRRGERTRAIDATMDKVVRSYVNAFFPDADYLSEETEATANLAPDQIVFRADAVDGTGNAVTLFSGYAIVVFAERVRNNGLSVAHLAGAIYTATGEVVSWGCHRRQGGVRVDIPQLATYGVELGVPESLRKLVATDETRTVWLTCDDDGAPSELLRAGDPLRVAVVAASAKRRRRLAELFDLDLGDPWVANLAGNPIAPALLLGELGGVVELERVLLHDAAYLIPFKLAGGYVCGFDGEPLDVFDRFEQIKSERTIGPFVAATNADSADKILGLLRRRQLAA